MRVDLKRLRELQKKRRLTVDEDTELGNLCGSRRAEILNLIPLPTCCEAARSHPVVYFAVEYVFDNADTNTSEGRWHVALNTDLMQAKDWSDTPPDPKFCPYCGTSLPKMKRQDPLPEDLCRVQDGGDYCSTCKERLMSCMCAPPESAFKPIPKKPACYCGAPSCDLCHGG